MGLRMSITDTKSRGPQAQKRRKVWGHPPPPPPPKEILKKVGYLRQHFVRFEGYLFGNEAGKNEGSSNNNPGKCLNSKLIFSNRTL